MVGNAMDKGIQILQVSKSMTQIEAELDRFGSFKTGMEDKYAQIFKQVNGLRAQLFSVTDRFDNVGGEVVAGGSPAFNMDVSQIKKQLREVGDIVAEQDNLARKLKTEIGGQIKMMAIQV